MDQGCRKKAAKTVSSSASETAHKKAASETPGTRAGPARLVVPGAEITCPGSASVFTTSDTFRP